LKLQRFTLKTTDYGDFPLLRPIPKEERQGDLLIIDPWGVLAPIRDDAPGLAKLIPVVSGETFSHALHGYVRPLVLALGPAPQALLKLTPTQVCALKDECIMYDRTRCRPHKMLPECWLPDEVPPSAREAVATVTLAWAEGRYVVVVEGPEFSL
jgi:hypothetical protein